VSQVGQGSGHRELLADLGDVAFAGVNLGQPDTGETVAEIGVQPRLGEGRPSSSSM